MGTRGVGIYAVFEMMAERLFWAPDKYRGRIRGGAGRIDCGAEGAGDRGIRAGSDGDEGGRGGMRESRSAATLT